MSKTDESKAAKSNQPSCHCGLHPKECANGNHEWMPTKWDCRSGMKSLDTIRCVKCLKRLDLTKLYNCEQTS